MQYFIWFFEKNNLFAKRWHEDRNYLLHRLSAAFLVLLVGVKYVDASESGLSWSGSWNDGEGGSVVVRQDGRFLSVQGRDSISVYRATCLLSEDMKKAECEGDGVQMQSGHRFLLSSQWIMHSGQFNETWTARFERGTLTGKQRFKPVVGQLN